MLNEIYAEKGCAWTELTIRGFETLNHDHDHAGLLVRAGPTGVVTQTKKNHDTQEAGREEQALDLSDVWCGPRCSENMDGFHDLDTRLCETPFYEQHI